MVSQDPSISGLNKSLAERRNTLHAEMIGLTDEHPGFQKAKEEIAEIDAALQLAFDDALGRARGILEQRRATEVDEERARATARVERAKLVVDSLAGEAERLRDRVGWFVTRFERGRAVEEEIGRHRRRLSDIDNREDLFKVESQSPGFARLQSRARTPDLPTRGGRIKYIVVFLILAAGLAVGAALVAGRLDPLIHTPDDIERAFGHAPLGWIVEGSDERMRGLAEDQLRRLALSLDRERRTRGTKVVAVTSPKPGSGTTTFVKELSQELVAVGVDVLTVDANAYHANQVNGQAGLIDLLERDVDPGVAIVPGLASHLPLGASAGARRLPGPHRLADLLATVGKDYDLVLVDAPPLLLSSDAELLVGLADATLLLVVAEVDDVVEVRRALTVLDRLAPPVGNIVLNRVRPAGSHGLGRDMAREFETGSRVESAGTLSRWLRS